MTRLSRGGNGGHEAGRVAQVIGESGGPFVPFERPRMVAEEAVAWFGPALDVW